MPPPGRRSSPTCAASPPGWWSRSSRSSRASRSSGAVAACSGRRCRGTGSSGRRCRRRGRWRCRPSGRRWRACSGVPVSPSRPASCLSGRIAIRLPPPLTQSLSIVTCAAVSGLFAEDHDVVASSTAASRSADVGDRELVQALGPQDLGVVAAERVGGVRDDQDRAARALVGRRRWRRRGRERPGRSAASGLPARS